MTSEAQFTGLKGIPLLPALFSGFDIGLVAIGRYAGEFGLLKGVLPVTPFGNDRIEVEKLFPLTMLGPETSGALTGEGSGSIVESATDRNSFADAVVPVFDADTNAALVPFRGNGQKQDSEKIIIRAYPISDARKSSCDGCDLEIEDDLKMLVEVILPVADQFLVIHLLIKKKPERSWTRQVFSRDLESVERNVHWGWERPFLILPKEEAEEEWNELFWWQLGDWQRQHTNLNDSLMDKPEGSFWPSIISAWYAGSQVTYLGNGYYQVVYSDGSVLTISLSWFIKLFLSVTERIFDLYEGLYQCRIEPTCVTSAERCHISSEELKGLYGTDFKGGGHSDRWYRRMSRRGHFRLDNAIHTCGNGRGCGFFDILKAMLQSRTTSSRERDALLHPDVPMDSAEGWGRTEKSSGSEAKSSSEQSEMSPDELVLQPVSILLQPRYQDILMELMKHLRLSDNWRELFRSYRSLDVYNYEVTLGRLHPASFNGALLEEGRLIFTELGNHGMTILELLYRLHRRGWKGIENVLYDGLNIRQYYPTEHGFVKLRRQLFDEVKQGEWVLRDNSQELLSEASEEYLEKIAAENAYELYDMRLKWFNNMLRRKYALTQKMIDDVAWIITEDHPWGYPPPPPHVATAPSLQQPASPYSHISPGPYPQVQPAGYYYPGSNFGYPALLPAYIQPGVHQLAPVHHEAAYQPQPGPSMHVPFHGLPPYMHASGMPNWATPFSIPTTYSPVPVSAPNSQSQTVNPLLPGQAFIPTPPQETPVEEVVTSSGGQDQTASLDVPIPVLESVLPETLFLPGLKREDRSPFSPDSGVDMRSPRFLSPDPMENSGDPLLSTDTTLTPGEMAVLSMYASMSTTVEQVVEIIYSRETLARLRDNAEEAAREFLRHKKAGTLLKSMRQSPLVD